MFARELDEIVRELYVLPPTEFVAARNELVRQARAAGSRDIAEQLQRLRRPTRSAWLVNLLARTRQPCRACRGWVGSCVMRRPGWSVRSCATWPSNAGT